MLIEATIDDTISIIHDDSAPCRPSWAVLAICPHFFAPLPLTADSPLSFQTYSSFVSPPNHHDQRVPPPHTHQGPTKNDALFHIVFSLFEWRSFCELPWKNDWRRRSVERRKEWMRHDCLRAWSVARGRAVPLHTCPRKKQFVLSSKKKKRWFSWRGDYFLEI